VAQDALKFTDFSIKFREIYGQCRGHYGSSSEIDPIYIFSTPAHSIASFSGVVWEFDLHP